MSEVLELPWGRPRIIKAVTTEDENRIKIYTNVSLSSQTVTNLSNANYPGILARRLAPSDSLWKPATTDTLLFKIQSFRYLALQQEGYVYEAQGFLCSKANCTESDSKVIEVGDSLAFNYAGNDGHMFALQSSQDPVTSTKDLTVNAFYWAGIYFP